MKAKPRTAIALVAVGVATLTAPAVAPASDDETRVSGECTGSTSSKLKAKPDDGRLEVEFEVDQNVNGERWRVKLKRGSQVVYEGTHKTRGRSGSFSVERKISDGPGTDTITGVARNRGSGERCKATLRI